MRKDVMAAAVACLVAGVGCDMLKDAVSKDEAKSEPEPSAPATVQPVATAAAPTPTPSATPPAIPTAAGAVKIGATVQMGEGKKKADVKVLALYGKLARVDKGKGGKEWVYLEDLDPAGTPLPVPLGDTCSVVRGQKVRPYGDKSWLARVGEVYGQMARVVYTDGELRWLACEKCDPAF